MNGATNLIWLVHLQIIKEQQQALMQWIQRKVHPMGNSKEESFLQKEKTHQLPHLNDTKKRSCIILLNTIALLNLSINTGIQRERVTMSFKRKDHMCMFWQLSRRCILMKRQDIILWNVLTLILSSELILNGWNVLCKDRKVRRRRKRPRQ